MVAAGLGVQLIRLPEVGKGSGELPLVIFGGLMLLAAVVIIIDLAIKPKRLGTMSAVYFGLLVGVFLTYVFHLALSPVLPDKSWVGTWSPIIIGMVLCYACISLILQTKDDFRFIIPYVEFAREVKGFKPYVLDTSVVIDGRIADVAETEILDSQLIMPRFVIAELQAVADSTDRLKRTRGRRGLDILNKLRGNPRVDLQIYDRDLPEFSGQPVDMKLVLLAKHLGGKIVTNDFNLNKVAKLHGVGVINLNELANALKPVFMTGEHIEVTIVKPGEQPGQGVGYLDDGTMIVVEGGRAHINRNVRVAVTSVVQTSAGRMFFGKFENLTERAAEPAPALADKELGARS